MKKNSFAFTSRYFPLIFQKKRPDSKYILATEIKNG